MIAELQRTVAALHDEIARLKGGPGRPDVKPNEPREWSVPRGTFVMKHASGKSWCGKHALFGADTTTKKGEHNVTFEDNHEYTLRLISQTFGNFPTMTISRHDF
jgi:hypothetical protein